jgi:hypothetical protein
MLIVLLVVLCCCSLIISGGIGTYSYWYKNPSKAPVALQFIKTPNHKLMGHKTVRLENIQNAEECRDKCSNQPFCLAATYQVKKKRCDLHYHSKDTKPPFYEPWDGYTYIHRKDPKSRMEVLPGKKMDDVSGVGKTVSAGSLEECAVECLKKKDYGGDICIGANYNSNLATQNCTLLVDDKNEQSYALTDNPGVTHLYKFGLPGQSCKKPADCMFGRCGGGSGSGICLTDDPQPTDTDCSLDAQCISGKCLKIKIPEAQREVWRAEKQKKLDEEKQKCTTYKKDSECKDKGEFCKWDDDTSKCTAWPPCSNAKTEKDCNKRKAFCEWDAKGCLIRVQGYEKKCK